MKPCRIAFYAPMKAPDHPVPSGDRRIGRLLIQALAALPGVSVDLACHLRSRDPSGDKAARFAALGAKAADLLVRRYERDPARRPDLWFTYHLYYKAPDWIGPQVAAALGIPYVVAEASLAPKRAEGAFAATHAAVAAALGQAAVSLTLNPRDGGVLQRALPGGAARTARAVCGPDPLSGGRRRPDGPSRSPRRTAGAAGGSALAVGRRHDAARG